MRKFLTILYALLAAACTVYYFLIGYTARFGLSMSTVWLALAAVFAIAAALNAWRKTPKWVNIAIRELFAVGLAALIVLEGLVFTGMHARPAENIEYLIILGARVEQDGPSPALQRRLNAALEYLAIIRRLKSSRPAVRARMNRRARRNVFAMRWFRRESRRNAF